MALSPTLAGFSGQAAGKMAGDELRRFLLQFFEDRPDQQPMIGGFYALRRTQLVWLMDKFGIDPAGTTAAVDLVRICEVAWMQGKFPKPPAPEDLGAIVRRLSAQVEELKAGAAAAPAPASPASAVVSAPPALAPEPDPAPRVTAYSGLSWDELKTLAKKSLPKGFKIHGRKREEIEDALDIDGVEVPGAEPAAPV